MRVPLRQFNFYKIPFLIVVTLELHNLICVRYVLSFHWLNLNAQPFDSVFQNSDLRFITQQLAEPGLQPYL
jgi:hypothetical protein